MAQKLELMHLLVCGNNCSRVFHRDPFWAHYWLTFIAMTSILFLGILMRVFIPMILPKCMWHGLTFCSRTLNNRINKLQERVLRILYKDDASSFIYLLEKDKSITNHEHNKKLLAIEMFKVKNDILPNVLGEFITKRDLSYNLKEPFRVSRAMK